MVPLRTVLREWGRIGLVGFGGPPAHVALLRELVVERRGWLSPKAFEDANAACGLLPGPASTQLAIYCGRHVAGWRGGVVGGLAFVLPGLLVILAIAAAALGDDPPAWIAGIGAGAAAAVVAVVVQAGLLLARTSVGSVRAAAYVAIGVLATVLAGAGVVLALLGCGLLELVIRRRPRGVLLAADGVLLAWTAFKVGALAYGGGFVIIPLMQADAVDANGWMTGTEFVNAVAYGQLTPGPVTHTVAVVGWAAAGLPGALLAALVAFGPSFLLVLVLAKRFDGLRENPTARAFLDGAGPAAVGAILGAVAPLFAALEDPWQYAVLAVAAVALTLRRSALLVLCGGALAGLVASLV
jgi:chromate transporter